MTCRPCQVLSRHFCPVRHVVYATQTFSQAGERVALVWNKEINKFCLTITFPVFTRDHIFLTLTLHIELPDQNHKNLDDAKEAILSLSKK